MATDLEAQGLRVIAEHRIPSDVELIAPLVEGIVARIRSEAPMNGRESEIDLAVREAVANAIVHGNRRDRSKLVTVTLARDAPGSLVVIVRDAGNGFDPGALEPPLAGDRLYASGGRGVFLMRSLVKDVTFRDGGREVRLRVA